MKIQFFFCYIILAVYSQQQQVVKYPVRLLQINPKTFSDIHSPSKSSTAGSIFLYVLDVQVGEGLKPFQLAIDVGGYQTSIRYYSCITSDECNDDQSLITTRVKINNQINYKMKFGQMRTDFSYQYFSQVNGFIGLHYFTQDIYQFDFGYVVPTVSLYIGEEDSEITHGGFNPEKINNITEIYNHTINTQLNGLNFTFSDSITPDKISIGIDSTNSYIMLNQEIFQNFQNQLIQKYNATVENVSGNKDKIFVSCYAALPDLKFQMTDSIGVNRFYNIPKSYYLYDIGQQQCLVLVQEEEPLSMFNLYQYSVVLGQPFLKRYVSILTNQTIGFSLSKTALESENNQNSSSWVIYVIIFGCILLVGLISFFVYKYLKRKREQNETILASINDNLVQNSQYNIGIGMNNENVSINQLKNDVQGQSINVQDKNNQQQNKKKDKYNQRTF